MRSKSTSPFERSISAPCSSAASFKWNSPSPAADVVSGTGWTPNGSTIVRVVHAGKETGSGLPFEPAAEDLLERNRTVLPRGEDPRDEVGADAEDRQQERGEDEQSHEPDIEAGDLGEASGDTAEDAVGTATETDSADGVEQCIHDRNTTHSSRHGQ